MTDWTFVLLDEFKLWSYSPSIKQSEVFLCWDGPILEVACIVLSELKPPSSLPGTSRLRRFLSVLNQATQINLEFFVVIFLSFLFSRN